MTERVLVTGGAGFIGSHLGERLLAEGAAVTVVDDLATGRREHVPAGAAFVEADAASPEMLARIARGDFTLICHLAAQMDVRRSVAEPVDDTRTNVVTTVALADAAVRAPQPPRFVFASTGGVIYGDYHTPPNTEDRHCEPDSPYAVAKLAAEHYLAYFGRIRGLDAVALRIGNVYGPRQDPHGEAGVVAIFAGRLLAGEPLTVFGDGDQTRDYIAVADVCGAFVRAARAPLAAPRTVHARAYNVGTGVGTSVLELARRLGEAAGVTPEIRFAPARTGEQQHSFLDVRKAERELGWRARTPLDEGLRTTWEWFAARHAARSAR